MAEERRAIGSAADLADHANLDRSHIVIVERERTERTPRTLIDARASTPVWERTAKAARSHQGATGPTDGGDRLQDRLMEDFDRRVAEQLGRRVRRRRQFLDLSQEALAGRAGIHRTQFSLYENGRRMPLASSLIKLAAALEVSVDQLLVGIEWPVPGPPLGVAQGGHQDD